MDHNPEYVKKSAIRNALVVVILLSWGTSAAVFYAQSDADTRRGWDVYDVCLASNTAATNNNTIIDTLAQLVGHTGALPPTDQRARLRIIEEIHKTPIIVCKKP